MKIKMMVFFSVMSFVSLSFAEVKNSKSTLNQCPEYLKSSSTSVPLSAEEKIKADIQNYLPPNAPLFMPTQILSWQETRVLNALAEDSLATLEKQLKESQIIFSDYFNVFATPTVGAPSDLQKATPEEIRMIAEYIYNTMKQDLEMSSGLTLEHLDDLFTARKVFQLTPKDKMIHLMGYNLVMIGGAEQFVTYKNNKNIIKNIRRWLRGL